MSVYYNENDPFAAAWLRNLIADNQIAPGWVDERSIEDVRPCEVEGFTQCHFFAGIGVWSLALRLAGWPDDRPIWTGSAPCQPFSAAGAGSGFADERHLWPAWYHLISQAKRADCPVVGEQVASKAGRTWFDLVSADMEAIGHGCGAVAFPAASVGAPHIRQRIYWLAHTEWDEQQGQESCRWSSGRVGWQQQSVSWDRTWQAALAEFRVLDDGIARSVATTDAYRNAIVAPQAACFIEAVMEHLSQ